MSEQKVNTEIDELSVEVIKEQIRESRIRQKEESKPVKRNVGLLLLSAAISVVSLSVPIALSYSSASVSIFVIAMPVCFTIFILSTVVFGYTFDKPTRTKSHKPWIDERKLRNQLSEIVLDGEIVSGIVGNQWSEITIDRQTYMLKIMARFVGEEKLEIETRSLVLNRDA